MTSIVFHCSKHHLLYATEERKYGAPLVPLWQKKKIIIIITILWPQDTISWPQDSNLWPQDINP